MKKQVSLLFGCKDIRKFLFLRFFLQTFDKTPLFLNETAE